jgi:uncharacterized protein (DUF58 family)
MPKTGLGRLVTAAAWLTMLVAFLIGSLAPALVALGLLAMQDGARRRLAGATLRLARRMPKTAPLDAAIETTTTAEAVPRVPITLTDEPPDALITIRRHHESRRGHAEERLVVKTIEPGTARWTHATVRLADPWGLNEDTRRQRLESSLEVRPETHWAVKGRSTGRRHTVQTTSRRRRALQPEPDVRGVRPWHPGDPARDIDWHRTSRHDEPYTKERERRAPRPVHILLDAGRTMRWRRRQSKLATATRLAYAVAASAQAAGVTASLTAFDETGTTTTRRAALGRRSLPQTLGRLARLDSAVPVTQLPAPPIETHATDDERAFLAATQPFARGTGPRHTPIEAALAALTRADTPASLVVAILDAETLPRQALVAARRLTGHGHQVVLVAPATGTHHYRRREATGTVLRHLTEYRLRRERLGRSLAAHRTPLLTLTPRNIDQVLTEVARWAQ